MFFFLMIRRPPRSTLDRSSAASDVYKRQDLTSADMLKSLAKELQGRGMVVAMADAHAPVREFSRKTGLLALIGEEHILSLIHISEPTRPY